MILIRFVVILVVLCGSLFPACQDSRRDRWQQPRRIIDSLEIRAGMVIGEAGAGSGYFTFYLAERIGPEGRIYANDISSSVLEEIKERSAKEGIINIFTVLGNEKDPLFPVDTLGMVIMMKAFHDFRYPQQWMKNVQKYIKPEAKLVIIDTDPDKSGYGHSHFMTRKEIEESMATTGFQLVEVKTFLQRDNIYIYQLPD